MHGQILRVHSGVTLHLRVPEERHRQSWGAYTRHTNRSGRGVRCIIAGFLVQPRGIAFELPSSEFRLIARGSMFELCDYIIRKAAESIGGASEREVGICERTGTTLSQLISPLRTFLYDRAVVESSSST